MGSDGKDAHTIWSPDPRYYMPSDAYGSSDRYGSIATPVWNRTGTKLAMVVPDTRLGDEGANWAIWVMDADGSHAHRLTDQAGNPLIAGRDQLVSWSPDSKRLVYESTTSSAAVGISTVAIKGEAPTRLLAPTVLGVPSVQVQSIGSLDWSPARASILAVVAGRLETFPRDRRPTDPAHRKRPVRPPVRLLLAGRVAYRRLHLCGGRLRRFSLRRPTDISPLCTGHRQGGRERRGAAAAPGGCGHPRGGVNAQPGPGDWLGLPPGVRPPPY